MKIKHALQGTVYIRIKTCLNTFFSTLLQGRLGKNTSYGSKALSEAFHRMLYTGSSPGFEEYIRNNIRNIADKLQQGVDLGNIPMLEVPELPKIIEEYDKILHEVKGYYSM